MKLNSHNLVMSAMKAKLAELFAARDPLYREVADIIIETSRQSVQSLVRQLEKQLPGT